MSLKKKAYDPRLDKNSSSKIASLSNAFKETITGVGCDKIQEGLPIYIKAPCETVLEGENGSYIVLGRDRTASRISGYGGRGDTQCASIDIVAGRQGPFSRAVDENGERVYTDPDLKNDAARIYISQKTDVDKNFGLPQGYYGNPKAKSAIALKADNIRIISRETVKIISGVDSHNSQGAVKRGNYGIELMANNTDKGMQPLVKGDNLIKALSTVLEHVDKQNAIIESLVSNYLELLIILETHVHATPAAPSAELIASSVVAMADIASTIYPSILNHKLNTSFIKLKYLNPMGKSYINSRFNRTN